MLFLHYIDMGYPIKDNIEFKYWCDSISHLIPKYLNRALWLATLLTLTPYVRKNLTKH